MGLDPVIVSPYFPILPTIKSGNVISEANAIEDFYKCFNITSVDARTYDGPTQVKKLLKDAAYSRQASDKFTEKSSFIMSLYTKFLENFQCN